MTATYTVDGVAVETVRRLSPALTESADHGAIGEGTITIDDPNGTLEIIGQKDFAADQDDCSNPISHRGFIAAREYNRSAESTGAGREISCSLEDLNAMLEFRGFVPADHPKRPRETVAQRAAWLLASARVVGLFVDNGRCVFSTTIEMDAADYTNGNPGDVLSDMALNVGGINWYIREFDVDVGPELVFRNDNTSTDDTSDVRISNVIADVTSDETGMTFFPSKDFTLRRDPARVKSKIAETYAKGTEYRERAATAAAFNGERFGTASNSNIKTATAAGRAANSVLRELSTEEDLLSGSILVPTEKCNLLNQGDRMSAKFSYLVPEGYSDFSWFRVLEVTRRPLLKAVDKYTLDLKLSPQTPPPGGACGYDATPGGTYYPLGRVGDGYGVEVTPKPSDGVVYYLRPGFYYPVTPMPGYGGEEGGWRWGFAQLGVGGAGTIDYAGDCVFNTLQFIVVGPGHMAVKTEIFEGATRPMAGSWGVSPNAYEFSLGTWTSGDLVEFDITGDCVNIIRMGDGPGTPCGGKWGWSAMEWTPA